MRSYGSRNSSRPRCESTISSPTRKDLVAKLLRVVVTCQDAFGDWKGDDTASPALFLAPLEARQETAALLSRVRSARVDA